LGVQAAEFPLARPKIRTPGCWQPGVPDLWVSESPKNVDRLFQFFRGAEGHFLRGLDLHRLTRGRVAAHTGGALADDQDAEAGETDTVAFLEVLRDESDNVVEHRLGLLFRQLVALGEVGREVLQADSVLFCLGGGFGSGHVFSTPV
jgi:hypothetical protein